jgi:8-oxo-dGTP pyrophosphatase MutT (NUDIX family)
VALDVYKEWLGIPEAPRPPDHYALLRLVQFDDDVDKIRKNYTKLNAHVRKYAGGQYSLQSQELLNELARAMLCLTDSRRKREYDQSLGREIEATGLPGRKSLGEWLVEQEHITGDQRDEVESFAEARGLSLRDAVVQMKLVDAETATRALAEELGLPFLDLNNTFPDDSVLDQVPRNFVKRYQFLPLFIDDDMLLVACVHEPTPDLEEEIRLRYGVPMRAVLATPLAINQAIAKYFAAGMRNEADAEQTAAGASKQKKTKRAAPKKRRSAAQMSPDEQRQQKLLGVIILCWSIVGAGVIGNFMIKPLLGPLGTYIAIALVTPVVGWFVWTNYFKK